MKGRFQRGRVAGVSPFFAFQDIVTSAMAVIITIVMLLALDMGDRSQARPGEPQAPGLREVDALREGREAAAETLGKLRMNVSAAVVESELAKWRTQIAAAAAQLKKAEEEAARSLAAMREAEARAKEAQLLAEQAKKNQLWLIPDRTQTSKEPVLAITAADLERADVALRAWGELFSIEDHVRQTLAVFEGMRAAATCPDRWYPRASLRGSGETAGSTGQK